MRIFKKHANIKGSELFKSDGEFNLTQELANMLDTILLILAVEGHSNLYKLNLELRKCGFFITYPELKKIIKKYVKDGYLSDNDFNLN